MPDSSYTKVDPNRLSIASDNITSSIDMLVNAFNAVQDTLDNTLKQTWTGDASRSFYEKYALDSETFTAHINALRSINNRLMNAAGIYDRADTEANELVRNLRID